MSNAQRSYIRADRLFAGAKGWLILTGDVPIYCETLKMVKATLDDKSTGYWPAHRTTNTEGLSQ